MVTSTSMGRPVSRSTRAEGLCWEQKRKESEEEEAGGSTKNGVSDALEGDVIMGGTHLSSNLGSEVDGALVDRVSELRRQREVGRSSDGLDLLAELEDRGADVLERGKEVDQGGSDEAGEGGPTAWRTEGKGQRGRAEGEERDASRAARGRSRSFRRRSPLRPVLCSARRELE